MNHRTWPVLLFALGFLFVLITTLGLTSIRKTHQMHNVMLDNEAAARNYARVLDDLKDSIYSTALATRDLVLDPRANEHIERIDELRSETQKKIRELEGLTKPEDRATVAGLVQEVNNYWHLLQPLLRWTPEERSRMGAPLLRRNLRGRRTAIVSTIEKVSLLNEGNLDRESAAGREMNRQLDEYLRSMTVVSVLLALFVVAGSVFRVTQLERRAAVHRRRVEEAEQAMRELSHKVVHAQEEERRNISRELHDEVGQLLTALRIELGNVQQASRNGDPLPYLAESKQLAEQSLRAVRSLAMGLRPSMLDDLGLVPAVEWQAREFSRRLGIPVEVEVEGNLDNLSDAHRTCIYRVVQEALTNCARHAKATNIVISIRNSRGRLLLNISDDGVGMKRERSREGLGLLGMRERVVELGGKLEIESGEDAGKGTKLMVEVPLYAGAAA